MKIVQPLKLWGGEHYLATDFIALMPRHLHYVEPWAGGLAANVSSVFPSAWRVVWQLSKPLLGIGAPCAWALPLWRRT